MLPFVFHRQLLAAANLYMANLAALAYEYPMSATLAIKEYAGNTQKVVVARAAALADKNETTGLPFFGRVVDERTAATINRQYILPLFDETSDKSLPRLYVDGSNFVNTQRSDCCIAWLIPRLPLQKPTPAVEDESKGPKPKKAKKQPHEADAVDAAPKPTHGIRFVDLNINLLVKLKDDDESSLSARNFVFRRPILADVSLDAGDCLRILTAWDMAEPLLKNKINIKATRKQFAGL